MTAGCFSAILLLATATTLSALQFKNSFIITNSDFGGGLTYTHTVTKDGWLLYGTSDGTNPEFNSKTKITAGDNGFTTDTILANFGTSGLLPPFNIDKDHATVRITIPYNDAKTPNFVFYLVKGNGVKNPPPVYDAGHNKVSISTDSSFFLAAATFISAAPFFTLSGFDIGSVSSVQVFPTGWDSTQNTKDDNVDSVLDVSTKEYAPRSFITIFGPIATVYTATIGKSKVQATSDTSNWNVWNFQAGAAITALSPGFISISQGIRYPIHPSLTNKTIHFDWTASKETPLTVKVQTNAGAGTLTLKTIAGSGSGTTHTYVGSSKKDNFKETAKEITVDYDLTPYKTNSVFLVQITSAGSVFSISFLLMAVAAMLMSRN